jgi:homoserine kinase type II
VSVYTSISRSELEFFFDRYALGTVISFQGISDGIDNSNYFVETSQGQFVLTLFENLTPTQLSPIIKLLTRLSSYRIPCPVPQLDKQQNPLRLLNNKPAAVFNCLLGSATKQPTLLQCQQIGLQLAELHDCTHDYAFPNTSPVLDECKTLYQRVEPKLSQTDSALIKDELRFQTLCYPDHLPMGVIHADLFKDNVLFHNGKISGILDFYSITKGALLFDIAVTVNDWCCDDSILNSEKVSALLTAYANLRPLTEQEQQHWQTLLRIAALRFWLSRLEHQLYPRTGELIQTKDPLFFRNLLEQHRQMSQAKNTL